MAELEVRGIGKSYGKKVALHNIDCRFTEGITALLGPNGAGKSTLLNILCTLLAADRGSVCYHGRDIREMKRAYLEKISVQFQSQPMHKNYTAAEYLRFCGVLKGMKKPDIVEQGGELLQYFGLGAEGKKKISAFSGGMKQRLALCGTFLGQPEIVFLDEPSAGLDIYEREELKQLLCRLKKDCILVISTHIVSDIENIADHIILLHHGEICSQGSQEELVSGIAGSVWELPEDMEWTGMGTVYHSDGKTLCIAKEKPTDRAVWKAPNLTDVYFNCLRKEDDGL